MEDGYYWVIESGELTVVQVEDGRVFFIDSYNSYPVSSVKFVEKIQQPSTAGVL